MKFNALIPELSVSDINVSKKFYLEVIGFDLEYERIEDKFVFISLNEAQIMLEQINGYWKTGLTEYPFGRGINFQIDVSDIEQLRERLVSNGYELFEDIATAEYREYVKTHKRKEFLVQDPDGYLLRFSQSL